MAVFGTGFASRWNGGQLVMYPGDIPGNCYFVDSVHGAAGNDGKSWDHPLLTIDAAVNKCTADHGDVIVVHPAHAENLAADSAVDVDVAGVTIIGLRQGDRMPTLTATAIAGDFKLAADNVTVRGIRFSGGVDATTGIVEISGANCSLIDCEYRDVTGQATDIVMVLTTGNYCTIDGLRVYGAAAAGGNSAIALDGVDVAEIKNCNIYGNFAVGAIDLRTAASTQVWVHDSVIQTVNAADIAVVDTITGSTGNMGPGLYLILLDDAANITEAITGATFRQLPPIYVNNAVAEQAMAINTTASTDA